MSTRLTRRAFGIGLVGVAQEMRSDRYDVVIIGAGVFGAWIAYECRRRHAWSVLLLDSRGPANAMASSGGETRILRVGYGPQKFYSEWALKSLHRWREVLEAATKCQLLLPTGVLWLGHRDEPYLEATNTVLSELSVRHEVLDSKAIRTRYPGIKVDGSYLGILEPDSGTILARRAVGAIVAEACRRGVHYRTSFVGSCECDGPLSDIVTVDGHTIRGDRFVFACGPWLPKMFPEILGDIIKPTRQEVFFFAPPPGDSGYASTLFPSWIDFHSEAIFYGCPNVEFRGIKAAADRHGNRIDPDTESRMPSAEELSAVRTFLRSRFPALYSSPCVEARVCQYENTRSGDFLIDRHPRSSNVWIVGGGSGHGFKHGPGVGEYVASLLVGGGIDGRFSLKEASTHNNRVIH